MKRIVSILLAIVNLFSLSAFAADSEKEKFVSNEPIILISGFMCSPLFSSFGTENQKKLWGPEKDIIFSAVKKDLKSTVKSIFKGNSESFGKEIGNTVNNVLSSLECDDNGNPKHKTAHYKNNPEFSNIKYMLSDNEGEYLYEIPFCTYLNSIADGNNIFCFQYDSRLTADIIADELSTFINDVLAYTGKKQVKLFALSYGGLIVTAYLYKYANNNLVSDAVLSVPALGGTDLPERILRGNIDINSNYLIKFLETATQSSSLFSSYFKKYEGKVVEKTASSICKELGKGVKNWGSIWCLCADDYYEDLKRDFLDKDKNRELIKRTDYIHYKVMANVKTIFADCKEKGMNISIICGEGTPLALGGKLNGDIVLPAEGVSGAVCAEIGTCLKDDNKLNCNKCENKTHNHISPDRTIDASCAYLPENTWFVKDHYHGQYYYEDYTRSLVTKLLFTNEIKDIYSSEDFPQFAVSNNSYKTISASFDNAKCGYIGEKSENLVITNLSERSIIKVLKVKNGDGNIKFNALTSEFIGKGENAEISFDGTLSGDELTEKITVYYVKIGALHPFRKAEFVFGTEN